VKRGMAARRTHMPVEGDTPGCCAVCNLPIAVPNQRHVDQLPAVDPDITAAEARRLGEHD
jgi:hypothetical protein